MKKHFFLKTSKAYTILRAESLEDAKIQAKNKSIEILEPIREATLDEVAIFKWHKQMKQLEE